MNLNETGQLEDRLRRLPLREPSAALDARIASLARRPTLARRRRPRVAGLALTATVLAASLLVLATWRAGIESRDGPLPIASSEKGDKPHSLHDGPRGASHNALFSKDAIAREEGPETVRIEQIWSAVAATEIIGRDNALPMQRVSRQVVRRVRLIDARRHVQMEWSIPGKQTVVAPLEFN